MDGDAALRVAARRAPGTYILAGELNADTLPGFVLPTPLALLREDVRGRTVIQSTTNGTVALNKSLDAAHVYAAALLNGSAVIRHVAQAHPEETVLIVCSGSADNFNLEDFYAAGHLVALFTQNHPGHEYSDAAMAARLLATRNNAQDCLRDARVGRMMRERGLADEVDYAARNDLFRRRAEVRGRPAARSRPRRGAAVRNGVATAVINLEHRSWNASPNISRTRSPVSTSCWNAPI